MKVKELVKQLKKLDQESEVFISGYEGGVDNLETITPVTVELDVNDEWYYGKHKVMYGEERKNNATYASGYLFEKCNKMKAIACYKASDGTLFESEDECKDYELAGYWIGGIREEFNYLDNLEIYDWIISNTKGFKDVKNP